MHAYHEDPGYYEDRAEGLLASAQDGTEAPTNAIKHAGSAATSVALTWSGPARGRTAGSRSSPACRSLSGAG